MPVCPHCAERRASLLAPRGERRVWKCGACRRQFSVLVGTVFERTHVPVSTWLAVVASSPLNAADIVRGWGVTPGTARFVLRRLAAAEGELAALGRPAPETEGAVASGAAGPRLAALLSLTPEQAARARLRSPARVRPRRQVGPTADYG